MTAKIRVILIESETLTCIGVKTILAASENIELVGFAKSGAAGLNLFQQIRPDITLLSLRLPDSCAVDSIGNYLKSAPNAKIIVLAAQAADVEINRSLKRGASGYVLKDVSAAELINAIETVDSGKKFVPANVAKIISEHLSDENLTLSEQRILEMIVFGKSNKEIAAGLGITENTVKTHVKNVLAKLEVTDRTAAATSAIKRGMVRIDY